MIKSVLPIKNIISQIELEDEMKKTKNIKRRNNLILLAAMISLLSLLLVGCSSEAATEPIKSEVEAEVKEEAQKVEEVVEVPEEAAVEKPIVEETVVEEKAEDLYIPEGIDMESTLPGEEWVASFVGKVAEPVVVIYNDNTGRKEVVQAGSEVTVNPDEDTIAVYWEKEGMISTPYAISVIKRYYFDYYEIYELDSERMRNVPERPANITVTGEGEEDWVIEFTILVE